MVDSCGDCRFCKDDGDHFCRHKTFTFNDTYRDGRGGLTYGGIADRIRLNGAFAFKIPPQISPAEAAPLLCAGITTYSPLKRFNAGPGKKVGVIGIGGLGHMALQWAHAMECDEVVAISTSDSKREESMKLGASKFVNLKNPEELQTLAGSLDIVLCTSFAKDTNWDQLLQLVAKHGTIVLLAIPEVPVQLTGITLLYCTMRFRWPDR
ncbi:hypothetical protein BGZ65_010691 [Modicella reniformis]|uniref:Alcohol dehydrogenase-like C-terminal domain-containing protein n=1 Tax=Modicella reniformis TaxID=1440133 RepID=A0A9P6IQI1_9FUNG|nr:hypothetical protein BGZ65_010691 [Modicella reniformis]